MAQITSSSGVFFMASCAWFWRSILLVAFLVRAREIRTTAKRGAPEILKRPTRLIDKGMDNHDPVVPKSKIQNPGLGVATLRIADEMQFVGAKGRPSAFIAFMARCRDANFRLVNSFSVRGVQEISTRVASSQHAALFAAFDAPERSKAATETMNATFTAASGLSGARSSRLNDASSPDCPADMHRFRIT